MQTVSLILRILMFLVVAYYFIKPQRLTEKRPQLSIKKARALLGVALCFLFVGFYFQYKSETSEKQSGLNQTQQDLKAKLEAKFRNELDKYPKELQQSHWTKLCQKANVETTLAQIPGFPVSTAELMSLTGCTCMAKELGGTSEFKKSEELLDSGKSFIDAMDGAFSKSLPLLEKIKPCQNLGV
jgi:hypothetical protein